MTPLTIIPDVEQVPIDTPNGVVGHGRVSDVALLRNGTASGRASIAIAITLPDGSKVIGETTYALFAGAARALAASPIAAAEPPPL